MARINLGNTPGYIALQVAPVMFRGGTGVGKSSTLRSLATALNRTFVPLFGATHLPEDFSGYPIPDPKAGFVRQMPTELWARTKDGRGFVLCDEVTNVAPATQGGMLSVLTEKLVGTYQMPESTIMVGAMNPPELCPNAAPLSPAMRSRFVHFDWEVDYDHWFAGLRSGCEWTAPTFPIVPDHWTDLLSQFGSLVEAFLRSAPDAREKLPTDDETLSFPNPRTWTYLVKVCAAAEACGYEWRKEKKDPIYRTLCAAAVGTEHASMFLQYAQKLDLLNPEEFLSGDVEYTYENRPDANVCLLTGLVKCLRSDPTKERWLRASEAFIEVGSHEIESFLMQFKSFWKPVKDGGVRPDGWTPPKETLGKLMALVQS